MSIEIAFSTNAKETASDLSQVSQKIEQIEESSGKTAKAVEGFSRTLSGLAKAAGAFVSINAISSASDMMTEWSNKIALVTGRTGELVKQQRALFRVAEQTRSSISGTVETFGAFGRALDKNKASMQDIMKATKSIQQAITISGASAGSAQAAIIQLSQGLASGTLRGEELNSVMEQTPRIAKAITDEMKITLGQLRAMAAEGKVTSDVVFRALLNQAGAISKEFKQMHGTISQTTTAMRDSATLFTAHLSKGLGLSEKIAAKFDNINKFIRTLDDNLDEALAKFWHIIADLNREFSKLFKFSAQDFRFLKDVGKYFWELAKVAGAVAKEVVLIFANLTAQVGQMMPKVFNRVPLFFRAQELIRQLDDDLNGGISFVFKKFSFNLYTSYRTPLEKAIRDFKTLGPKFWTSFMMGDPLAWKRLASIQNLNKYVKGIENIRRTLQNSNTFSIRGNIVNVVHRLAMEFDYLSSVVNIFDNRFLFFRRGNMQSLLMTIRDVIRGISEVPVRFYRVTDAVIDNFADASYGVLLAIRDVINKIIEAMVNGVRSVGTTISELFNRLTGSFKSSTLSFDWLTKPLNALKRGVDSLTSAVNKTLRGFVSGIVNLFKKTSLFKLSFDIDLGPVKNLFADVKKAFGRSEPSFTSSLSAMFKKSGRIVTDAASSLTSGVSRSFSGVGRLLRNFKNTLADAFSGFTFTKSTGGLTSSLLNSFEKAFDAIVSQLSKVIRKSVNVFTNFVESLGGSLTSGLKGIKHLFSSVVNLGRSLVSVFSPIVSALRSVGEQAKSAIASVQRLFRNISRPSIKMPKFSLGSVFDTKSWKMPKLEFKLVDSFTREYKSFEKTVKNFWGKLSFNLPKLDLKNSFELPNIKSKFTPLIDTFKEIGKAAVDSVKKMTNFSKLSKSLSKLTRVRPDYNRQFGYKKFRQSFNLDLGKARYGSLYDMIIDRGIFKPVDGRVSLSKYLKREFEFAKIDAKEFSKSLKGYISGSVDFKELATDFKVFIKGLRDAFLALGSMQLFDGVRTQFKAFTDYLAEAYKKLNIKHFADGLKNQISKIDLPEINLKVNAEGFTELRKRIATGIKENWQGTKDLIADYKDALSRVYVIKNPFAKSPTQRMQDAVGTRVSAINEAVKDLGAIVKVLPKYLKSEDSPKAAVDKATADTTEAKNFWDLIIKTVGKALPPQLADILQGANTTAMAMLYHGLGPSIMKVLPTLAPLENAVRRQTGISGDTYSDITTYIGGEMGKFYTEMYKSLGLSMRATVQGYTALSEAVADSIPGISGLFKGLSTLSNFAGLGNLPTIAAILGLASSAGGLKETKDKRTGEVTGYEAKDASKVSEYFKGSPLQMFGQMAGKGLGIWAYMRDAEYKVNQGKTEDLSLIQKLVGNIGAWRLAGLAGSAVMSTNTMQQALDMGPLTSLLLRGGLASAAIFGGGGTGDLFKNIQAKGESLLERGVLTAVAKAQNFLVANGRFASKDDKLNAYMSTKTYAPDNPNLDTPEKLFTATQESIKALSESIKSNFKWLLVDKIKPFFMRALFGEKPEEMQQQIIDYAKQSIIDLKEILSDLFKGIGESAKGGQGFFSKALSTIIEPLKTAGGFIAGTVEAGLSKKGILGSIFDKSRTKRSIFQDFGYKNSPLEDYYRRNNGGMPPEGYQGWFDDTKARIDKTLQAPSFIWNQLKKIKEAEESGDALKEYYAKHGKDVPAGYQGWFDDTKARIDKTLQAPSFIWNQLKKIKEAEENNDVLKEYYAKHGKDVPAGYKGWFDSIKAKASEAVSKVNVSSLVDQGKALASSAIDKSRNLTSVVADKASLYKNAVSTIWEGLERAKLGSHLKDAGFVKYPYADFAKALAAREGVGSDQQAISNFLANNVNRDIPVYRGEDLLSGFKAFGDVSVFGGYYPQADLMALAPQMVSDSNDDYQRVFNHESTHAFMKAIVNTEKLTPEVQARIDALTVIFQAVRSLYMNDALREVDAINKGQVFAKRRDALQGVDPTKAIYGLGNGDEFLAEAFSLSPSTRAALDSTPLPKGLPAVLDYFSQLGIKADAGETTRYTFNTIADLIANQSKQQAGYEGFQKAFVGVSKDIDFDHFDFNYLNSQAGQNLYGFGQYLSSSRNIAEKYARGWHPDKELLQVRSKNKDDDYILRTLLKPDYKSALSFMPNVEGIAKEIASRSNLLSKEIPEDYAEELKEQIVALQKLDPEQLYLDRSLGNILSVDIPDNDRLLNLNASLNDQSVYVKKALYRLAKDLSGSKDASGIFKNISSFDNFFSEFGGLQGHEFQKNLQDFFTQRFNQNGGLASVAPYKQNLIAGMKSGREGWIDASFIMADYGILGNRHKDSLDARDIPAMHNPDGSVEDFWNYVLFRPDAGHIVNSRIRENQSEQSGYKGFLGKLGNTLKSKLNTDSLRSLVDSSTNIISGIPNKMPDIRESFEQLASTTSNLKTAVKRALVFKVTGFERNTLSEYSNKFAEMPDLNSDRQSIRKFITENANKNLSVFNAKNIENWQKFAGETSGGFYSPSLKAIGLPPIEYKDPLTGGLFESLGISDPALDAQISLGQRNTALQHFIHETTHSVLEKPNESDPRVKALSTIFNETRAPHLDAKLQELDAKNKGQIFAQGNNPLASDASATLIYGLTNGDEFLAELLALSDSLITALNKIVETRADSINVPDYYKDLGIKTDISPVGKYAFNLAADLVKERSQKGYKGFNFDAAYKFDPEANVNKLSERNISGLSLEEYTKKVEAQLDYIKNPTKYARLQDLSGITDLSQLDTARKSKVHELIMEYANSGAKYVDDGLASLDTSKMEMNIDKGVNCIGLVEAFFKTLAGVDLGNLKFDFDKQIQAGVLKPVKDMQSAIEGDVIQFVTERLNEVGETVRDYHIGIYDGKGNVLHAKNEAEGVLLESLPELLKKSPATQAQFARVNLEQGVRNKILDRLLNRNIETQRRLHGIDNVFYDNETIARLEAQLKAAKDYAAGKTEGFVDKYMGFGYGGFNAESRADAALGGIASATGRGLFGSLSRLMISLPSLVMLGKGLWDAHSRNTAKDRIIDASGNEIWTSGGWADAVLRENAAAHPEEFWGHNIMSTISNMILPTIGLGAIGTAFASNKLIDAYAKRQGEKTRDMFSKAFASNNMEQLQAGWMSVSEATRRKIIESSAAKGANKQVLEDLISGKQQVSYATLEANQAELIEAAGLNQEQLAKLKGTGLRTTALASGTMALGTAGGSWIGRKLGSVLSGGDPLYTNMGGTLGMGLAQSVLGAIDPSKLAAFAMAGLKFAAPVAATVAAGGALYLWLFGEKGKRMELLDKAILKVKKLFGLSVAAEAESSSGLSRSQSEFLKAQGITLDYNLQDLDLRALSSEQKKRIEANNKALAEEVLQGAEEVDSTGALSSSRRAAIQSRIDANRVLIDRYAGAQTDFDKQFDNNLARRLYGHNKTVWQDIGSFFSGLGVRGSSLQMGLLGFEEYRSAIELTQGEVNEKISDSLQLLNGVERQYGEIQKEISSINDQLDDQNLSTKERIKLEDRRIALMKQADRLYKDSVRNNTGLAEGLGATHRYDKYDQLALSSGRLERVLGNDYSVSMKSRKDLTEARRDYWEVTSREEIPFGYYATADDVFRDENNRFQLREWAPLGGYGSEEGDRRSFVGNLLRWNPEGTLAKDIADFFDEWQDEQNAEIDARIKSNREAAETYVAAKNEGRNVAQAYMDSDGTVHTVAKQEADKREKWEKLRQKQYIADLEALARLHTKLLKDTLNRFETNFAKIGVKLDTSDMRMPNFNWNIQGGPSGEEYLRPESMGTKYFETLRDLSEAEMRMASARNDEDYEKARAERNKSFSELSKYDVLGTMEQLSQAAEALSKYEPISPDDRNWSQNMRDILGTFAKSMKDIAIEENVLRSKKDLSSLIQGTWFSGVDRRIIRTLSDSQYNAAAGHARNANRYGQFLDFDYDVLNNTLNHRSKLKDDIKNAKATTEEAGSWWNLFSGGADAVDFYRTAQKRVDEVQKAIDVDDKTLKPILESDIGKLIVKDSKVVEGARSILMQYEKNEQRKAFDEIFNGAVANNQGMKLAGMLTPNVNSELLFKNLGKEGISLLKSIKDLKQANEDAQDSSTATIEEQIKASQELNKALFLVGEKARSAADAMSDVSSGTGLQTYQLGRVSAGDRAEAIRLAAMQRFLEFQSKNATPAQFEALLPKFIAVADAQEELKYRYSQSALDGYNNISGLVGNNMTLSSLPAGVAETYQRLTDNLKRIEREASKANIDEMPKFTAALDEARQKINEFKDSLTLESMASRINKATGMDFTDVQLFNMDEGELNTLLDYTKDYEKVQSDFQTSLAGMLVDKFNNVSDVLKEGNKSTEVLKDKVVPENIAALSQIESDMRTSLQNIESNGITIKNISELAGMVSGGEGFTSISPQEGNVAFRIVSSGNNAMDQIANTIAKFESNFQAIEGGEVIKNHQGTADRGGFQLNKMNWSSAAKVLGVARDDNRMATDADYANKMGYAHLANIINTNQSATVEEIFRLYTGGSRKVNPNYVSTVEKRLAHFAKLMGTTADAMRSRRAADVFGKVNPVGNFEYYHGGASGGRGITVDALKSPDYFEFSKTFKEHARKLAAQADASVSFSLSPWLDDEGKGNFGEDTVNDTRFKRFAAVAQGYAGLDLSSNNIRKALQSKAFNITNPTDEQIDLIRSYAKNFFSTEDLFRDWDTTKALYEKHGPAFGFEYDSMWSEEYLKSQAAVFARFIMHGLLDTNALEILSPTSELKAGNPAVKALTEHSKAVQADTKALSSRTKAQESTYKAFGTANGSMPYDGSYRPVGNAKISSGFGQRIHPVTGKRSFHNGVDYAVPEGTQIHARANGIVTGFLEDAINGFGIKIRQLGTNIEDRFVHLKEKPNFKVGDTVSEGQVVGLTGKSGRGTGPHLHHTVVLIDPATGKWTYIDPTKAASATKVLESGRGVSKDQVREQQRKLSERWATLPPDALKPEDIDSIIKDPRYQGRENLLKAIQGRGYSGNLNLSELSRNSLRSVWETGGPALEAINQDLRDGILSPSQAEAYSRNILAGSLGGVDAVEKAMVLNPMTKDPRFRIDTEELSRRPYAKQAYDKAYAEYQARMQEINARRNEISVEYYNELCRQAEVSFKNSLSVISHLSEDFIERQNRAAEDVNNAGKDAFRDQLKNMITGKEKFSFKEIFRAMGDRMLDKSIDTFVEGIWGPHGLGIEGMVESGVKGTMDIVHGIATGNLTPWKDVKLLPEINAGGLLPWFNNKLRSALGFGTEDTASKAVEVSTETAAAISDSVMKTPEEIVADIQSGKDIYAKYKPGTDEWLEDHPALKKYLPQSTAFTAFNNQDTLLTRPELATPGIIADDSKIYADSPEALAEYMKPGGEAETGITTGTTAITDSLSSFVEKLKEIGTSVWDTITALAETLWNGIKKLFGFGDEGDKASDIAETSTKAAEKVADAVTGSTEEKGSSVGNTAAKAGQKVAQKVANAVSGGGSSGGGASTRSGGAYSGGGAVGVGQRNFLADFAADPIKGTIGGLARVADWGGSLFGQDWGLYDKLYGNTPSLPSTVFANTPSLGADPAGLLANSVPVTASEIGANGFQLASNAPALASAGLATNSASGAILAGNNAFAGLQAGAGVANVGQMTGALTPMMTQAGMSGAAAAGTTMGAGAGAGAGATGAAMQGASAAGPWGMAIAAALMLAMQLFGKHAQGGIIRGPGTGTSDSIPALLSNGEFVVNAAATRHNRALLERLNAGASLTDTQRILDARLNPGNNTASVAGFAEGGYVSDGLVALTTEPVPTDGLSPTPTANSLNAMERESKAIEEARNNNKPIQQSTFNIDITGDISRQTRNEIMQMMPRIAQGVNRHNHEKGNN